MLNAVRKMRHSVDGIVRALPPTYNLGDGEPEGSEKH